MTEVIRSAATLPRKVAAWKRSGMLVGVVPTMEGLPARRPSTCAGRARAIPTG